ncbi:hypothetical protein [Nocardioides hungaricus]
MLLVVLLVGVGCSADPGPPGPQEDGTPEKGPARVDPQVLEDVAAGAFMAPGPSVRRAMRVSNFTADFVTIACGGTPPPLDRTSDRIEQSRFPDLELIRRRGFVEPAVYPKGERRNCGGNSKGNLLDKVPSEQKWTGLSFAWEDVVATVEQDERVVALKVPMARCLREGSGLEVSDEEPAPSFLGAVNTAYFGGPMTEKGLKRMAVLYADCGADYFGLTQKLLEAQRPAWIERNREVLVQFAKEIVAIGYVP